jgi:hypothetical protein
MPNTLSYADVKGPVKSKNASNVKKRDYSFPELSVLTQVSQYLSTTVAPCTSKIAICVDILPQLTQTLFLSFSFVTCSKERSDLNFFYSPIY